MVFIKMEENNHKQMKAEKLPELEEMWITVRKF